MRNNRLLILPVILLLATACQAISPTAAPTSTPTETLIPPTSTITLTPTITFTLTSTATPLSVATYLADLTPFSMYTNSPIKAGIFPVTDNGLGMTAGQLLAWHGREFPHGFVVGPDTTLTYDLSNLKPFLFHADVTRIFSNSCGDGVDFVVLGDMREIARVHLRQDSEAVLPIDVNVNNVRMLTLLIEPLDSYDCDEAIWGDPIVYAYANPAEAPTSLPSQTPTAVSVTPIPDKMVWSYYGVVSQCLIDAMVVR